VRTLASRVEVDAGLAGVPADRRRERHAPLR
jgi:hypothetical protein